MGERRAHPVVAVLIVLATLACGFVGAGLVLYLFAFGEGGGGWTFLVITLLVLMGGIWIARRVGRGGPGPSPSSDRPSPSSDLPYRRTVAAPATPRSQPASPPDPMVFAACPGCGRVVNRQVGRCPYCQAQVEGGEDG